MDVEVVKSELAQVTVESGIEENNSLLHEKENGTVHQGFELTEPIKFGSHSVDEPLNGEGNNAHVANFPKDAADEWPAQKQNHSFYFVRYRSYDDPKLKAKLEQVDKDLQKKSQQRSQILDKIRAKRSDRARLFEQMKPLSSENKQFWLLRDEKRKEMEPLQQALGKLRSNNSVNREKGVGLCSSEEELNNLIKSLHFRIQHESIPLSEEKQILREIKQLEGTREKVIAQDAMRAKIQDSLGEKEAIQDQVKLMGVDLDGVRKEQQVVKAKLKQLTEEKEAIDKEIKTLEVELAAVSEKREKAYETLLELKKQRVEGNTCYYQNRTLLNKVKDLTAKKDIEAIKEISTVEVEKFMSLWNNSKAFRDDYERRILPSLDMRLLSKDGRMRNPDEKPLVLQDIPASTETEAVTKTNIKRPKDDSISSPVDTTSAVEKVQKEAQNKPQKVAKNKVTGSGTTLEPIESEEKGVISGSEKLQKDSQSKPKEVDEAKLKEMRREEEIAKAKQALERKKKLAEKAAAKAAIKAQKEAEKKLKDREKKAKKKAGASALVSEPEEQPTELDPNVAEPETAEEKIEAAVPSKNKDRKGNAMRHRNRPKGPDSLPRSILKRKKLTNYWVWAAPAALSLMMLLVVGYKYFL
ncbi:Proton pump-interactor like [Actinidia chinensis var. chinensis]|uniref:Proton pump-interactor like n=1 Tax=Actinidia chinensis var. chinensis TaxID=1590841 RepID=A0A2R6PSF6_ACTCC|nr:Proton pump-interactor like [Actinidia chinensis var. chinensis]